MRINYRDWDPKIGTVPVDIQKDLAEEVKMMKDSSVVPPQRLPKRLPVRDMTDPEVRANRPQRIPKARGAKK